LKILGLDFETTGIDGTQCRVLEIGAVVWDTELKKPLAIQSEIIYPEGLTEIPLESEKVHGISMETLKTYGTDGKTGFLRLIELLKTCEYVVAHNAPFEQSFLINEIENYGIEFDAKKIKWIDTMSDIAYPEDVQTRKLTYLAAEHGILNSHSHRAVTDVLAMLGILAQYPFEEIVFRSQSPTIQVVAKVSFDEKDKAKNLGFYWNPKNKTWFKEFKEMDLEGKNFPFEIETL